MDQGYVHVEISRKIYCTVQSQFRAETEQTLKHSVCINVFAMWVL